MGGFQHILVPVDFTEKNEVALSIAAELARQSAGRITLLHVIETIDQAADEEIRQFYARLEAKAKKDMARIAAPLVEAGMSVGQELVFGKRGPEIVRHAAERHVDLVVLSSHTLTPDDVHGGWATLSYQAALFCPCPVLLVK